MNDTTEDLHSTVREQSVRLLGAALNILLQQDWCSGRIGSLQLWWERDHDDLICAVVVPEEHVPGAVTIQRDTDREPDTVEEEFGAQRLVAILRWVLRGGLLDEHGSIDFDIKHDGEGRRWAASADLNWTDRDLGNEPATEDR